MPNQYTPTAIILTIAGYGVFVRNTGRVSFELQSERTTRVNISVPGEKLEYYVIYGPNPKSIIDKYTALTGRPWCDFEFDDEMFPDARGYLERLKGRGLKVCVWINPYIGQESRLFAEGKENGYFITSTTHNGVWQWDEWQYDQGSNPFAVKTVLISECRAGMALVDFTNPEACAWYKGYLGKLVEMGVDSFKTDFGEQIPSKGIKYHNNADPVRMHNYYTHLYNKTVHEALQEKLGNMQGCLFARSATAGGQSLPVHWGGDCACTFEAMAETLRGGLSLGICGFGFWAHDIGGFEGTPTRALYNRWCQFGLLSSHSRLHGSGSYRVPWLFGEDCSEVLRDCVLRKICLTPYLLAAALESTTHGTPLLRATFLEYPHDRNVWNIDTQYFLGPNLLVAPIFTESGEVTFYVPEELNDESKGKWVSWFDHKKTYTGGKWYTETHGFSTLPLLIRPGTVTPINKKIKRPEEDHRGDGLELLVNGNTEGVVQVKLVDPKRPEVVQEVLEVSFKGGESSVSRSGIQLTSVA
ncbi:31 glycoside hydrolase [Pseudogymnoascus australis]